MRFARLRERYRYISIQEEPKMRHLILAIATLCLFMVGAANAVIYDFETPGGYTVFADPGATAERTTEQAYAGSYSGKLALEGDTNLYARFGWDFNGLALSSMTGSFKTYVTAGSAANLIPYMMFAVDANFNGIYDYGATGDALIIAFVTGGDPYATDTWLDTGMDGSTTVHVVGNRSGLGAGEFSSSGTQDTLAALSALTFDSSYSWGDLQVIHGRVAAGLWPGGESFEGYIDDVYFSTAAVPVPAAIWLLGSGLLGLAGVRKKMR